MIPALAVLKKKMADKPWLYQEEEHAVLKLAEDAVEFIKAMSFTDHPDESPESAVQWLGEHT